MGNQKIEQIKLLLLQADLDLTKAIDLLHEAIKNKTIPADMGSHGTHGQNTRVRKVERVGETGKRTKIYS